MGKKFTAPQNNPFMPQEPPKETKEYYRFNAKLPIECKDFLQEMAWRNRTTITDYLGKVLLEYMAAHPEWKESIDVLNK